MHVQLAQLQLVLKAAACSVAETAEVPLHDHINALWPKSSIGSRPSTSTSSLLSWCAAVTSVAVSRALPLLNYITLKLLPPAIMVICEPPYEWEENLGFSRVALSKKPRCAIVMNCICLILCFILY